MALSSSNGRSRSSFWSSVRMLARCWRLRAGMILALAVVPLACSLSAGPTLQPGQRQEPQVVQQEVYLAGQAGESLPIVQAANSYWPFFGYNSYTSPGIYYPGYPDVFIYPNSPYFPYYNYYSPNLYPYYHHYPYAYYFPYYNFYNSPVYNYYGSPRYGLFGWPYMGP